MADEKSQPWSVDLSGQVAVVTGASRGIGREISLTLARSGAKLACVARNAEKLAEIVQDVRETGGEAEAFSCDVADPDSVNSVVDKIAEKWENISILVNNAGITQDTLLLRMSDSQWTDVINTNLTG
ncbi:MAG: SDR family NAD(P)-dependent oxidoreductase, partial [Planctomycetales bacterium]